MNRMTTVVAGLVLIGANVNAGAASISYYLDQTNIDSGALVDGVPYALVTIDDNVPNQLNFTVSLLASLTSIAGSNFGIDNFAFNVVGANPLQDSGTVAGQWTLPAGWAGNVEPPAIQADGFGRFDARVDGGGSTRLTTLSFSLNNTALTLYSFAEASHNGNGQGNVYFAAHIAGFSPGAPASSGYFGGSTLTAVPLPASLPLLLTGIGLCLRNIRRRVSVQG